jgi:hypothetical protein
MSTVLVAAGAALLQAIVMPQGTPQLQRGVVVQPESVSVGDPFRVVVRVRAPRGAVLEFPTAPDSGFGVEPLDPLVVIPSRDSTITEQTATYRLAAWDVGHLPLRFQDILVRSDGVTQRLAIGRDLSINVGSVLPADSSLRVPKPPRPVFEFGPPWWWWLLVALAAILVIGLFWWWWRRRREVPHEELDPYLLAQREFARIEELDLVASGERGHYVALVVEVVRNYLARAVPAAKGSLTTSELAQGLRSDGRIPLVRLVRLLHETDLVKFARHPVGATRAQELGAEARGFVDAVHAATQPEPVREAA